MMDIKPIVLPKPAKVNENQEPKGEELTPEQIEALKNLDAENVPNPDEPKVEETEDEVKPLIPENENPSLTKSLVEFREQIGKPTKGCEHLVNAVIHKRTYTEGNLVSKPYLQYFDEREYKNFLNHPGGYVVEVEIHNPFKK